MTPTELKNRKIAYHKYLRSSQAGVERFLDRLDEDRNKLDRGLDAQKSFRELARRAWHE